MNLYKRLLCLTIVFSLGLTILLSSCGNSAEHDKSSSNDTTITDSYQRMVKVTENPKRIISAAPGITEIVFALGEGQRLIGRTDYCDFPARVKSIPSIGGLEDPNIEVISGMNPDLVIASTHFQKEVLDKLDKLNIPVVVLKNQESFDGAYQLIKDVAKILNVTRRADSIVSTMKSQVAGISQKVNLIKVKPSVYFVIGFGKTGDFTAGGNTFINDLIKMAGGVNIASDLKGWSYSKEMLIQKDPDIILIRTGDKELFSKTEGYSNLTAVKNGKVYEVNNNLFEITGPRLSEGLQTLFDILHK